VSAKVHVAVNPSKTIQVELKGTDGKCRSCGAPIWWIVTDAGKYMPVDPNPDGDVTQPLLSHFATCPAATQHRRPRTSAPPDPAVLRREYDRGVRDGHKEAQAAGTIGLRREYQRGFRDGRAEGYDRGSSEGHALGVEQGKRLGSIPLTEDLWRHLVLAVHPDRHQGKPTERDATVLTRWLIEHKPNGAKK
jgi:hypothetical protein